MEFRILIPLVYRKELILKTLKELLVFIGQLLLTVKPHSLGQVSCLTEPLQQHQIPHTQLKFFWEESHGTFLSRLWLKLLLSLEM